jgi:tripartite-type tricarboxylate transporter receptor subunit TctC
MGIVTRRVAIGWLGGLAAGTAANTATAQSVAQFYKGRQITLIVGTAPGGINDISARFVARYLGKYIPGNPAIVVENQPGAGGITSAQSPRQHRARRRLGDRQARARGAASRHPGRSERAL